MRIPHLSKLLPIISGSFRVLNNLLFLLIVIVVASILTFIGVYFHFARNLPEIRTLEDYRPPVISEVFANDGSKIGEFWTECRIYRPYTAIPKQVVQAFLAAEDTRFFEHKGVDVRSIIRALIVNIKAGTVAQGGSTITQQITRSLLLTRERTVTRKIKEAILATRLERRLNKEQILTLYLNQIFLGNRAYGVSAAARNYFHKNLEELTLGQIAILAGLPSAPTSFSPINNPQGARARQAFVLKRMLEEELITEHEMEQSLGEQFEIYAAGIDKEFTEPDAGFFVEHVRRLVKEKYGDDTLYQQGLKIYTTMDKKMQRASQTSVRRGLEEIDHHRYPWKGPVAHVDPSKIDEEAARIQRRMVEEQHGIITLWPPERKDIPVRTVSIDPDKNYRAIVAGFSGGDIVIKVGSLRTVIPTKGYAWIRQSPQRALAVGDIVLVHRTDNASDTGDTATFALTRIPELQAALFSMDPHTGFVKALVGGYDFALSEFNRATQALRQPGSSFKPFAYAAALDKGYTFNTTIMDTPVVFQVGKHTFWSPKNYGGGHKGPTPFENCLKFSRNIPTVKITFDIGMHYLAAFARKMGLTTPIDKYLSMALGANVVSLSEMVPGFAVFVANGAYHRPIAITKIIDNKGAVLEEVTDAEARKPQFPPEPAQVERQTISEETKKFIESIDTNELNMPLFENQKQWLAKDDLFLTDMDIKTLYGKSIPEGHIITPQTAYLMVKLLRGVVLGGTGTRLRALEKPSGGKTGTTNDETDAWFISTMPNLVSGVWVGFDEIKRIGYGATGGNTASPIVLDYLKQVTEGEEAKEFEPPQGFPISSIASLTGGSAIFGVRTPLSFPGEFGGDDLAGEFFEQDMEYPSEFDGSSSYGARGYQPPAPSYDEYRSYPDF